MVAVVVDVVTRVVVEIVNVVVKQNDDAPSKQFYITVVIVAVAVLVLLLLLMLLLVLWLMLLMSVMFLSRKMIMLQVSRFILLW